MSVRLGPFGEQLETYLSRAFAVCDHQAAHIYVRDPTDVPRVHDLLAGVQGVARLLRGEERAEVGLRHERSGEIVALSQRDAWFAYPFWLDDHLAPDYARTVAIHHKPGYDPCELFVDPAIRFPMLSVGRRVIQKKLGFRMKMDVIPLDASLIRGSHGLPAEHEQDGPILVGDGAKPNGTIPMSSVRDRVLEAMDLAE